MKIPIVLAIAITVLFVTSSSRSEDPPPPIFGFPQLRWDMSKQEVANHAGAKMFLHNNLYGQTLRSFGLPYKEMWDLNFRVTFEFRRSGRLGAVEYFRQPCDLRAYNRILKDLLEKAGPRPSVSVKGATELKDHFAAWSTVTQDYLLTLYNRCDNRYVRYRWLQVEQCKTNSGSGNQRLCLYGALKTLQ